MKRMILVAAVVLTTGWVAHAQQQADAPDSSSQASLAATGQTEELRLRREGHDRMTVPVRLSGVGPYYFLVDTGADRTAISRDLATRLKLISADNARLHSLSGVSTVATADVPHLQLTRHPVSIRQAPVLNAHQMGADGILGVDSLHSQRVVFDFERQTMSVVPSSVAERRAEPGAIVIQARRRNGRLIIDEATAQGSAVTVILDTGAQVSIGNSALRERLRIPHGRTPEGRVTLESVTGGKVEGDLFKIPEVVVGGVTLTQLVVVFADAHTFKQLKLDKKPALLLGMNAMRAFKKVSIDFANRKFRVVVPEHSSRQVQLASAG